MKEPSYLIFGVAGLLGKPVFERLCETVPEHRVFPFEHSHVNISNKQHVKELFDYIKPSIVINCAAISSPEICEYAQAGAFETNEVGPKILAEQCAKIDAKLVHFSTSAVFNGSRFQPYSERCKTAPVNVYGRSKLQGELSIQAATNNYLIIRTGWVFNVDAPNFLLDWLDQIDRKLVISAPADVHGSPTFAMDLISATKELIDRGAKGVFHVANSQAATWASLADAVVDLTKGSKRVDGLGRKKADHMAPDPRYTVLSSSKFESLTGAKMRPWPSALKQCLFYMERYKP